MDIYTQRLHLRSFVPEDGERLYSYLSDPDTVFFEPYGPFSREAAMEEAVNRSRDPAFIAVCARDADVLIGNLYLARGERDEWELGYVFHPDSRGMGYATEAARAAVGNAFEQLGARRVVAHCALQNAPSWRLMERLGMRREGVHLQSTCFKADQRGEPIWWDGCDYAILRAEWFSRNPA